MFLLAHSGVLIVLVNVCFRRNSGHRADIRQCLLLTQSCFGATSPCSPLRAAKYEIEVQNTFSILPFLNLTISEMQETSHWLTHRWNVISEQRKSNWQHPNSYYREREETEHSATDECDTSRHPHPFRTLPTKAVQITADPGRNVILEALHFLVEIGNLRHRFVPMAARRKRSPWDQHAQATMWRALIGRDPQTVEPARRKSN